MVHAAGPERDGVAGWCHRLGGFVVDLCIIIVGCGVERLQRRSIGRRGRRRFMAGSGQRHGRQRVTAVVERLQRLRQQWRFEQWRIVRGWRRRRLVSGADGMTWVAPSNAARSLQ